MKVRIEWMEGYMADAERLITDNRVDEGLTILQNLLYDEPGYGSLHNHLGWAYMYHTPDSEKAELHFTMAMRFDASYAPPYLHLGNLYNRTGRYTAAIEQFTRGLSAVGANRVALYEGLALAHEMRKEFRAAIKSYKEAIAGSAGMEFNHLREGIKRCRSKRWVMLFD